MTVGAGVKAEFDRLNAEIEACAEVRKSLVRTIDLRTAEIERLKKDDWSMCPVCALGQKQVADLQAFVAAFDAWWGVKSRDFDVKEEGLRREMLRVRHDLTVAPVTHKTQTLCVSTEDGKCLIQKSIEALGDPRESVTGGPGTLHDYKYSGGDHGEWRCNNYGCDKLYPSSPSGEADKTPCPGTPVVPHNCGGQMACPEPTCPEYAR